MEKQVETYKIPDAVGEALCCYLLGFEQTRNRPTHNYWKMCYKTKARRLSNNIKDLYSWMRRKTDRGKTWSEDDEEKYPIHSYRQKKSNKNLTVVSFFFGGELQ